MGTVKGIRAKLLVVLIVFMIVFSNCGFTLAAIATSDEFQVITNGFFKKDEIKFNAYFEDKNGKEITETTENVNQKVRLILDILPQVEGYLKSADLKAVSEDGSDVNFKITGVSYYQEENDLLEGKPNTNLDVNNEENKGEENATVEIPEVVEDTVTTEETENTNTVNVSDEVENVVENTTSTVENVVADDELSGGTIADTKAVSGTSNTTNENVVNEVSNDVENTLTNSVENVIENTTTNTVTENTVTNSSINNEVVDEVKEEILSEELPENDVVEENEDILIDEDKVIEEKTEEATIEEDLSYDMKVISDNEIQLRNIIKDTKIVLELEYKMGEKLNVDDLMKNIHLQLSGTYINSDLEEVQVAKEAVVTLGWEYTKDVELTSEYTKFSPFEVGEIKGTIVENKITVKREISDEKYLPIKNTSLEVGVPKVNGKTPIEINVICEKLLATRGEDTGNTTFVKDNWSYDAGTGKIQISVENEQLAYTSGMDEYVIIYRYEDMIDAENSDLDKNVKLTVEEYSGKENHRIEKEIKEIQSIKVDVGELITYNISSTEEKINKAKTYANYNNETPIYETEYTNQVNVNILTSDILEELKINCNQEVYKDVNGFEFEAEGIEYRRVKFSFSEITTLLVNGGEIVITNEAGEVLYTLNKDVIKTEEDCEINLNGQTGIIIYARNIAKNGNLNFELVKVIKGCNYEKSAFKNFTSIESRISAEVKYQKIEERLALPTIGTAKQFEESTTLATLSINKETLSTTKSNENVEIKIELNNDKENSDLYVNPAFEVVFPKHVKDVTIQNANVLYENGLKISKIDTYKENDIPKIRVELEGTQKTFSESSITNGTNIIVNANIEVDEYTPKKEDQIKLYYCNEGVSTYQAQTKWSISKVVPNDILKTTNGFDVAIIKYQAPNGLIAINGIVNYDGNLSEVKSVKQGEVKEQIDVNSSAKIMTMELLALNNTDNKCTDIVLLGRIPFAGVKDVITNQDLGTTTNTVMKDLIKEDIQNTNTVDIYYSTNAEATKDLDNIGNGWTKEVRDINEVKSFLVVVKGSMEAGQVLRYTYDFEVPANLPYETNIEGSFGAFYNNNSEIAVIYESSVADTVGLTTEKGPKLEVSLMSDIEDGQQIGSDRIINYTVVVHNNGSITANNVKIKVDIPSYTSLYQRINNSLVYDYGYNKSNDREYVDVIDELLPGETYESKFLLKTDVKPQLEQYASGKDENGYYINVPIKNNDDNDYGEVGNDKHEKDQKEYDHTYVEQYEKQYITKVPEQYIICKAKISSSMMANEIETNEIKNELVYSNFSIISNIDFETATNYMSYENERNYTCTFKNISGNDLSNVNLALDVGKIYDFVSAELDGKEIEGKLDETEGKIYINVGNLNKDEVHKVVIKVKVKLIPDAMVENQCHFELYTEEGIKEDGIMMYAYVCKYAVTAEDITLTVPNKINENDKVTISTKVINKGKATAKDVYMTTKINRDIVDVENVICGSQYLNKGDGASDTFSDLLPIIKGEESITIDIIVKAKNLAGIENTEFTIDRTIQCLNQENIVLEPIKIEVENNLKTIEEEEEERVNNYIKDNDIDINSNPKTNEEIKEETSDTNQSSTEKENQNINNNSSNTENNNLNNEVINNETKNNEKKNNEAKNNDSKENTSNVEEKYAISGKVWLDRNKNGIKDDSDKEVNTGTNVYLLNSSTKSMIQSASTSSNGSYTFNNVSKGKYVVAFVYDKEMYGVTIYKVANTSEDKNSDAIENNSGFASAITNEVQVDGNIENLDLGLVIRDTLDLTVNKYISSIIVSTSKGNTEYKFDNDELAKVEIKAKELDGALVKLNYKIIVENIGDIDGTVENIVDYMPNDMKFDEEENESWYIASDGYIYLKNSSNEVLSPGEKKEYNLSLTKEMNDENTGTVSNKVALLNVYTDNNVLENKDNNMSTQNVLILISTGNTIQIIIFILAVLIVSFIIYINKNNVKFINNNHFGKNKVKMKKVYR